MKWAGILKDTCLFYANLPNFQIKLTFDNWYAIMSLIKSVIIFCALLKIDILEKKEECRKMKKILSVVLIAMMLATAVPAQVLSLIHISLTGKLFCDILDTNYSRRCVDVGYSLNTGQ